MDTKIPKGFLTAIRLGPEGGPYAGRLATPCPCGESLDDDEPKVVADMMDGRITLMHERCIPRPLSTDE